MSAAAPVVAVMDDAGFILGSYALTAVAVLAVVVATVRRARRLAPLVRDEDKPWT